MENEFSFKDTCPIRKSDLSIEFITPDKAREYLANQRGNRGIKRSNFYKLVGDIKNGYWKVNGETVKFDRHGRLGDGQHRMKAIIEAGVGVWSVVVRNLPDEAFNTMDVGSTRTAGDIFKFNGVPDSTNQSGMVRAYHAIKAQAPGSVSRSTGGCVKDAAISPVMLLDEYESDEAMFAVAYSIGRSAYKKIHLFTSSFCSALVYYLMKDLNHPEHVIKDFYKQLFFQQEVSMQVILRLRDVLVEDLLKKDRRAKMTNEYKIILLVKTWNAFVTKKDLKSLSWKPNIEKPIWFI